MGLGDGLAQYFLLGLPDFAKTQNVVSLGRPNTRGCAVAAAGAGLPRWRILVRHVVAHHSSTVAKNRFMFWVPPSGGVQYQQ